MQRDLLSGVEKNIELQAAGLLALSREEFAFSEARGEIAHQVFADRLRACLNLYLEIQILENGWYKLRVLQVSSDHFLAIDNSRIFLIKFSSLIAIKGLTSSTKVASKFDTSWRVNSTFRQWMIDQGDVSFYLPGGISLNGKIRRIFKDHIELATDNGIVAINTDTLILAVNTHVE